MKKKSLVLFFLMTFSDLWSNMRAPTIIYQYPSYSIFSASNQLTVAKEDLEFSCPEVYKGIAQKFRMVECIVTATYKILSKSQNEYNFEFILPSSNKAKVTINSNPLNLIDPKLLSFSIQQLDLYRILSKEHTKVGFENQSLYSAAFNGQLKSGTNQIVVQYSQPVSTQEFGYSYFKDGRWIHSISYELWPLKEWNLSVDFQIQLKFSTIVGNKFQRLFSKEAKSWCNGIDLKFDSYPYSLLKKDYSLSMKSIKNIDYLIWTSHNPYSDPLEFKSKEYYDLNSVQKTSYVGDKKLYEVEFKKKFPDRLLCRFGYE